MTERFIVPKDVSAVDVPRIVRDEVLDCIRRWCEPSLRTTAMLWFSARYDGALMEAGEREEIGRRTYLAARFGEVEIPSEPCGKPGCTDPRCRPSATAELSLATPHPTLTDAGYRLMSPAEQDFLRALAVKALVDAEVRWARPGRNETEEMLTAARRVTEEAR